MCVAMVIIHSKTLDKKPVDDGTSTESLHLYEPPVMSQGTALFTCGIADSSQWATVGRGCSGLVGSGLESLWDGTEETGSARDVGGISGLLQNLSLGEAPSPRSAAPPSKRQCRSLSCSDELNGCRSSWRPQGSRFWTTVEKRRCHSGGSVQRGASSTFSPSAFPVMQRSSSFSLPTSTNLLEPFGQSPQMQQARYLSHEQICPVDASSPESTPELQRRSGLSRSCSQPCVHNDKKTGVKRRRPADSHKQRPSLDLVKMTQNLSCVGFTGDGCAPFAFMSDITSDRTQLATKEDIIIDQSNDSRTRGVTHGMERECLWVGICGERGRDVFQLGGELDIEQIERN